MTIPINEVGHSSLYLSCHLEQEGRLAMASESSCRFLQVYVCEFQVTTNTLGFTFSESLAS